MTRENWFGGNPLAVVVRLVLLSIVVGVVLSALGITPRNFLFEIEMLASRIYRLGLSSFGWVLQYLLLGAMVVVPVWLVARLMGLLGTARRTGVDTVGGGKSKHDPDA